LPLPTLPFAEIFSLSAIGMPWRPLLNVVLRDHVVHLWGTLTDERERRALVVLAENVPAVQAVLWIEPTSGFAMESMEDEELERRRRFKRGPSARRQSRLRGL
jgi:hypothetical protein